MSLVPGAPPSSGGGKLVLFEGDYVHFTLTDTLYLVCAVLVVVAFVLIVQQIIRLGDRVSNIEFQVAFLNPEERPNVVAAIQSDDDPDDTENAAPASLPPASSGGRPRSSPARRRPRGAAARPRPSRVRPIIDLSDPHAVRAALRAQLGVEVTLPAKRQELLQLFESTFPPIP